MKPGLSAPKFRGNLTARNPDGLSKVMSILMVAGDRVSDDFMREIENLPVQERDTPNGL